MKRTIETLNEMSFDLPEGWAIVEDKYKLPNGQGFINRENYLSQDGRVISLFEIHRDPDDFFEYYQKLVEGYSRTTDMYELEKEITLKFGEFEFPIYITKGYREKVIHVLQAFINCGDRVACFMINIDKVYDDARKMIKENQTFADLVKILRTIE